MSTTNGTDGHSTFPVVSPDFNAADGDFVLISKDDVRFHVNRASLSYGSVVFKDMFSVGESSEDGTPELRLEEDSATLEAILPYLYPKSVPPLAVAFPFITNFVDACEKYQIDRGIDAAREAYLAVVSTEHRGNTSHVKKLLHAFVFADRFDQKRMTDLTSEQLRRIDLSEIVEHYDNVICSSFAATQLLRALSVRFANYTRLRDECLEGLARDLARPGGRNCTRETVNAAYAWWIEGTTYSNFFHGASSSLGTGCNHCDNIARGKINRLAAGFDRVS